MEEGWVVVMVDCLLCPVDFRQIQCLLGAVRTVGVRLQVELASVGDWVGARELSVSEQLL